MIYSKQEYNNVFERVGKAVGYNPGLDINNVGMQAWFAPLLKQPIKYNEYWQVLLNTFCFASAKKNFFKSAFDVFRERRDTVGRGTYETVANPVFPLQYDMCAFDRILKCYNPEMAVQYFEINVNDTYPLTINTEYAEDAFCSYEAFDSVLESIMNAPANGQVIIENNMTKELLNANIASGAIKTRQYTKPTTKDGWLDLANQIRTIAMEMSSEPSKDYNNYVNIEGSNGVEIWSQSDRKDLILIGSSDVISAINTYVLNDFNEKFVDFKFTFVPLTTTGYTEYNRTTREWGAKHEGLFDFIICDGGFLKLEDNFRATLQQGNVMTMGIQVAMQVRQTLGVRAYRNAIAFTSNANAILEDITLNPDISTNSIVLNAATPQEEITITTDPADYEAKWNVATVPISATITNGTDINVVRNTDVMYLLENTITANVGDDTISVEADHNEAKIASIKEYLTGKGYTIGDNATVSLFFDIVVSDVYSNKTVKGSGVNNINFTS